MKKLKISLKSFNKYHFFFLLSLVFMLFSFIRHYTHQNRHNLSFVYNYKQYVERKNGLKLKTLSSTNFTDEHFSIMSYSFSNSGDGVLFTSEAHVVERHKNVFEYCLYDSEVEDFTEHKTDPHFEELFFTASDIVMKTRTRDVSRSAVNYFSQHIVLIKGGIFEFPTLVSRSRSPQYVPVT